MAPCYMKRCSRSDHRLWAPHIPHTDVMPASTDRSLSPALLICCCHVQHLVMPLTMMKAADLLSTFVFIFLIVGPGLQTEVDKSGLLISSRPSVLTKTTVASRFHELQLAN